MKKSALTLFISLLAPLSMADLYLGGGVQLNVPIANTDDVERIDVGNKTLDLSRDDSEEGFRIIGGYRVGPSFGVELTYTYFEQSVDKEEFVSAVQERELEASVDVNQVTAMATYHIPVDERLAIRPSVGVAFHNAKVRSSEKLDNEDAPDEVVSKDSEEYNAFGGAVGIGLVYSVWQGIELLADVQYSYTPIFQNVSAMAGASYRF